MVEMRKGEVFKNLISDECKDEDVAGSLDYKQPDGEWRSVGLDMMENKKVIKEIDPCDVYELRINFNGQYLEIPTLGPYTQMNLDPEEIHMEDGPSYFEKKIKSLTHSKINDDQTKMSWTNDFCGEITVSFWKNQADPDPLCTASRGETSCIMNLEPCKTYTMDVSLNIAGNEDTYYDLPQELELTTQPSQAQLDQVFGENSVTNGVVNWDFSRVMDDLSYSCIGRFSYSLQDGDGKAVQGNTGTDIVPGRDEKPIVRVNTTSQLQCGGQLVMKVSYSLQGEEDVIEVAPFTQTVQRTLAENPTSLSVSGTEVTITRDVCSTSDLTVNIEPRGGLNNRIAKIEPFILDKGTKSFNFADRVQDLSPCVAYKVKLSDSGLEENIEQTKSLGKPRVKIVPSNNRTTIQIVGEEGEETCRVSAYRIKCDRKDSTTIEEDVGEGTEFDLDVDIQEIDECKASIVYEVDGDDQTRESQLSDPFKIKTSKLVFSELEEEETSPTFPVPSASDPAPRVLPKSPALSTYINSSTRAGPAGWLIVLAVAGKALGGI